MRVVKVTEDDRVGRTAGINTGRHLALGQTLSAHIAFFNNSAHSGRELRIDILDVFIVTARIKFPGTAPVETPGPVRTGSHAETTADAAMEIHQNHTVVILEGSL